MHYWRINDLAWISSLLADEAELEQPFKNYAVEVLSPIGEAFHDLSVLEVEGELADLASGCFITLLFEPFEEYVACLLCF